MGSTELHFDLWQWEVEHLQICLSGTYLVLILSCASNQNQGQNRQFTWFEDLIEQKPALDEIGHH